MTLTILELSIAGNSPLFAHTRWAKSWWWCSCEVDNKLSLSLTPFTPVLRDHP